jgi:hypothetical protein
MQASTRVAFIYWTYNPVGRPPKMKIWMAWLVLTFSPIDVPPPRCASDLTPDMLPQRCPAI